MHSALQLMESAVLAAIRRNEITYLWGIKVETRLASELRGQAKSRKCQRKAKKPERSEPCRADPPPTLIHKTRGETGDL